MGRVLVFAFFFCLATTLASAQDRALERVADIRVELAQDRHNLRVGKLTSEEQARRSEALNNEARALLMPYQRKSREDYEKAQSTITGLVNAKLALLRPRWDSELQDFRKAASGQRQQTTLEMETDARRAVEYQRQRLALQRQLDSGLIDRDGFAQRDRAAVTAIAALRRKYEATGGDWPAQFDQRLTQLSRDLTKKPVTGSAPQGTGETRPYTKPGPAHTPPPAFEFWTKSSFPWGYIFAALIGGLVLLIVFGRKTKTDSGPPLTEVHGSANWAARQEKPSSSIGCGVMFGKSSHPRAPPDAPGAPVTSAPEAHTLIVAQTGAGKGVRIIVPTLLRYESSMIVIDPKGENAAITARTRRDQLGHKVHILNPWGEMEALYRQLGFAPDAFNPLDVLERNDPNAVSIAESLAATICPSPKSDANPFWSNSAAAVLTGIFLWLTDRADQQKTLARARELATMTQPDFAKILASMASSEAFGGAIREMVSPMIGLAENTYSGIMSTLAENTKFLSDPRVKASTASSSFSMRRLHDELTTVYVVIPHDRMETQSTWLRLIIAAAMQGLKSRDKTVPARHRCMFMIDEFGSIGHIADIPRDIALMRGFGLDFTLIVQGLDQLKNHYGDARGTILGNCAYKWFCHVSDLDTAKYLSETLGKETVRTISKSMSSGQTKGGATEGESMSFSETGRLLLMPDEILKMGRDAAILLGPAAPPHYLRPVDYWKLAETFAHLKEQYPSFYWDPPLQFDKNPYVDSSDARSGRSSQASAKMTEAQAREILEVTATATKDEILAAYRRLIARVHPDKGGSKYLAQQINAAKAVLLGE